MRLCEPVLWDKLDPRGMEHGNTAHYTKSILFSSRRLDLRLFLLPECDLSWNRIPTRHMFPTTGVGRRDEGRGAALYARTIVDLHMRIAWCRKPPGFFSCMFF